ncbi:GTPase [Nocardioides sp.]|uniref:GTPase n=1 Tax=Nocardioides sp. TaxID=35761 RepID=UPI0027323377|nr:GTPase [Nocardioides sp.]MDP3893138.1 GTPase [Nocardioides sp.]
MTSMLEGARRLVTRGSDLGDRVAGLQSATEAARGRIDDEILDDVQVVVDRVGSRLKLSADHTVVAIAGATGSGKSSTFNALTDLELSAVGVRRPTTSWATACVWGREGADELLEWLGIAPRHQVTRDSMLDTGREDNALQGVVLLDLPDHDSTEVSHHLEVDRLVTHADLLVWVLDPQKYADAAVHDRYFKPMASHQEVMLVVLNHIDTVPQERREAMVADVRRLLADDGLPEVPVIAASAREGVGIDEIKRQIAQRVVAKRATKARLSADVKKTAEALETVSGTTKPPSLPRERVAELEDSFADAGGVPTVVAAVHKSAKMRANRATGWPVVAWFSRLKPDPLKRLHLDLGSSGRELTGRSRTSVPQQTLVQRARVDTAVRGLADDVSRDLRTPWATAIRNASTSRLDDLGDRLDASLGAIDLADAARVPVWAKLVRVLQWLLILSALAGGIWLGVLAVMSYLRVPEPPTPELEGFAVPTIMLVGGVVLGLVLAFLCRFLVAATARRRARVADRQLREGISEVVADLVVAPIEAELAAYTQVREGLARARR